MTIAHTGISSRETEPAPVDSVRGNEIQGSVSMSEVSTDEDDSSIHSSRLASLCPKGDQMMVARFLRFLQCSNLTEENPLMRSIFKVVRMLRTCKYEGEDIASVLAVSAIHHKIFLTKHVAVVSSTERSFILLAQIYIAHCVVLDEYCCVSNWHKYLFANYCDLKSLNGAVARILKKLDWSLHVCADEVAALVRAFTS